MLEGGAPTAPGCDGPFTTCTTADSLPEASMEGLAMSRVVCSFLSKPADAGWGSLEALSGCRGCMPLLKATASNSVVYQQLCAPRSVSKLT